MTQKEVILKHLKSGKSITPLQALNNYGCFRLGARIYDLRAAGHRITMRLINRQSKFGVKTYAEYSLNK